MQLSVTHENNIAIVTISESRLDASTAPEFKLQMDEVIRKGQERIILDISSIKFMDSSSLGAMVVVLKSMGNNGKLVINGASGVVLELFKLTRMNNVFNLSNNLDEAKASFTVDAT